MMLKFKLNPASLGDTMKLTDASFEMKIDCAISQTSLKHWFNVNANVEEAFPGYVQMASSRTQNLYKRTTTLLYRKHSFSDAFLYRTLFQVILKETGDLVFPREPNAVLVLTVTPGENRLHSAIHLVIHYNRNHPEPEQFIQLLKVLAKNFAAKLNEH